MTFTLHRLPPFRRESGSYPRICIASLIAAFFTGLIHVVAAQPASPKTPNDFFKAGPPTFVLGTAGDELANRALKAQAEMVRDLLFPTAKLIDDSMIEVANGPAAWPRNPVLYGGPHVNQVLAKLGPSLPFRMERGKLTLDDQTFEGDEYQLLAVIPARSIDKDGPGYPSFMLYAGNGSPGVTEINGVRHGGESILVADAFGRLLTGSWQQATGGTVVPIFSGPRARRIAWRSIDRELKTSPTARPMAVKMRFPQQLPAAEDEDLIIQACLRGLARASEKIGAAGGADLFIYVYPDLNSIASLTRQRGDGHAVVDARVLHVVRYDPAVGGGLETLLAHEGTHVLAHETWGTAGTSLLGEGLAVWASGAYGGVSLDDWKRRMQQPLPAVADLLGKSFRQMPESKSYPLAGILVGVAVEKLGVAKVREHLFGATRLTWDLACKEAGTTAHELEAAFRAAMAR